MENTIIQGDCLSVLKTLPNGYVQTVVTSPPYFGLRDYGTAKWTGGDSECDHKTPDTRKGNYPNSDRKQQTNIGSFGYREWKQCGKCGAIREDSQIGLEPSPDEYVSKLVEVFREVRRVLRDDGTVFLNLGDSYASVKSRYSSSAHSLSGKDRGEPSDRNKPDLYGNKIGLKEKDLIGIPWRVAFALQADGWYLRQDIIWAKGCSGNYTGGSVMPESVTDRCTKAHEYIFLLSKSQSYFYDNEAVKEEAAQPIGSPKLTGQHKSDADGFTTNGTGKSTLGSNQGAGNRNRRSVWTDDNVLDEFIRYAESQGADVMGLIDGFIAGQADKKDVWTITTRPYKGAHFATFPPKLVEPCILAGSSDKACPTCGKAWERATEKEWVKHPNGLGNGTKTKRRQLYENPTSTFVTGGQNIYKTIGFSPSCSCGCSDSVGSVVMDIFAGSGTTLAVAKQFGRRYIGVELNPKYIELANERLATLQKAQESAEPVLELF